MTFWTALRAQLLNRLWYVIPSAVVVVNAAPADCLRALSEAARPNLARLHLRNLFTDGRRYYLDPDGDHFRMTSSSKVPWRRRARTTIAAVVLGEVQPAGEGSTRIRLRARMRFLYFCDIFFIPLFMTSLLIFAPWPPLLIAMLATLLFALSWGWHRWTAALQAIDIVYFIERALEDWTPKAAVGALAPGGPDVITQEREFREQWQKFYEQHKDEREG